MRHFFVVKIDASADKEEAKEYIEEALLSHGGGFLASDPFFGLEANDIHVTSIEEPALGKPVVLPNPVTTLSNMRSLSSEEKLTLADTNLKEDIPEGPIAKIGSYAGGLVLMGVLFYGLITALKDFGQFMLEFSSH